MSRESRRIAAPPHLAEHLVRLLLPREERQELLGDLHERWSMVRTRHGPTRAALWYWTQALGALPWLLRGRFASVPRRGRLSTTRRWNLLAVGRPLRILKREPGFCLAAVTVLALGIGVPTTMYSIEHGIFRPLPVPRPEEVVAVQRTDPLSLRSLGFSATQYEELRDGLTSMHAVAAYRSERLQLDEWDGGATLVSGAAVSPSIFPLLGVEPIRGRTLTGDDGRAAAAVVVIGERLWRERLGARDDILGSVVRVNGIRRTVVGVMPEGFGFPVNARAWIPLRLDRASVDPAPLQVVGRLEDGMTPARARAQVAASLGSSDARVSASTEAPGPIATVVPFQETFLGRGTVARAMLLLFSFLLVIAAANVANLLLSRAVQRRKELAVRMALGSSRRRIVAEQLARSVLLAGLGTASGVVLAWTGMEWFRRTLGTSIDVWWVSLHLDRSTIAFAAVAGILVSVMAGIAPALQASAVALQDAMREGVTSSFRHARFSRISVGAQLALSCAMLILVAQIVRGVGRSDSSFEGLSPEGVLVGQVHLGDFDYPDAPARSALAHDLAARLAELPGGGGSALGTSIPGTPAPTVSLGLPGAADDAGASSAQVRRVTPGFLSLFRIEVVEGRAFDARIASATASDSSRLREALVDERLARALAPRGSALGMHLLLPGSHTAVARQAVVVGVVRDPGVSVDQRGHPQPTLFLPLAAAAPSDIMLFVRRTPAVSMADVRHAVARIDPHLPLYRTGVLLDLVRGSRSLERRLAGLFSAFGVVALVLALIGLHALVSFTVGRNIREIGIRRALGASRLRVVRGAIRGTAPAVATGLAVGIALALLVAPAIGPVLWGGGAHERGTFLLVPAALAIVSVLAAALPGGKAAAMDPVRALRVE